MSMLIEINQPGKREDLRDFISLIDAKEKPLLAMAKQYESPGNMLINWQADAYDAPNPDNAIADGVDVGTVDNKAKNRASIQAYAQKFRKTYGVGDLAENISQVAGAKSGEVARSIEKCNEEITRDIEAALCSDNECQLEESEAKPYKLRGLGKWLLSTAQATLPVPAAFRTPAASLDATAMASLTEDGIFKPVLASLFGQYGKRQDLTFLVGTTLKTTITAFTQYAGSASNYASSRSFLQDADSKKIVSSITVYEGDFNTVQIHPSLLLATNTSSAASLRRGYLLAMDNLGIAWSRKPRTKALQDQGGGPRGYLDAILSLIYKNPLMGAKFSAAT